jgi:hypothetical protein
MHIYPQLQSGPLLSLGMFADDVCQVILTKNSPRNQEKLPTHCNKSHHYRRPK